MFAVSGWNLATAPKTQVIETGKASKKHTNNPKKKKSGNTASDTNAIPLSKKRNLPGMDEAVEAAEPESERVPNKNNSSNNNTSVKNTVVTPDNVLALYEKVIEGKAAKRSRDRKKRKEKKERIVVEQDTATTKEDDPAAPAKEKEGRKKKHSKLDDGDQSGIPKDAASDEAAPPKKKKKQDNKKISDPETTTPAAVAPDPPATLKPALSTMPALTPLQQKMRAKLTSARFRHINEILYTTPSDSSLSLFTSQPEMYQEYHAGFRRQVEVWPENPVDIFIKALQDRSKIKFERGHNKKWNNTEKGLLPLPRDREEGWCTVADLGCGDAKIAATINHQKPRGKGKVKILSYDLQASTKDVTVADIAHLPLEPESVDIVIFCLALMGINFLDFIEEAYRVLRWRGELWVAEIKSRFHRPASTKGITVGSKKGKKEEDDGESIEPDGSKKPDTETYKSFIDALSKRGFTLRGQVDSGNKMFVRMEFVKIPEREKRIQDDEEESERQGQGETWKAKKKKSKFLEGEVDESKILKPCVYKLR
ncbi:hypothetical protein P167DRAFT_538344 [Morchella conica CCBAS932]|uniref:Ribosomal RNA-processing protein 8 n=1 Tax=Morchella conica CCBAS932 TaxID=1392247 RepID=A0A3N4KV48_9PEZI|nr:hypothetical protein P167DRAFT_538344 [Morchella conica CCBAS932]